MAHLLGAEQISLEFPTKTVFDNVTLGLNDGDRVGIVGRNGDGKSTLIKLLAKRLEPDSGRITHRKDLRVGLLDQADQIDPGKTIGQAVVGDLEEHEWAGDAKIRDVISGLLTDLDFSRQIKDLSGGQRRRVTLAALLVQDFDIIMLDEPTNHLDIEGVAWLAAHLKNRWSANTAAFVVVTHDRWFLDEVCNLTWEVHDGIVEPFEGGYAAYILQRAERDRSAAATENKRQNLLRKELAWLSRGAPARTTKPKFRVDAAADLIAGEPEPRDRVELSKLATARLGKDVVDVENVSYSIGGRQLLNDVTWRLGPGDRLGLVGVNGAGKTTLLKLMAGALEQDSGKIKRGKTVVMATLSQDVRELDEFANDKIFELIAREKTYFQVDKKEVNITQLVEQLGFSSAQLQTPVGELSGGQRRRLQLLRLLFGEPNVLILDEPTNDLDTDMLAAIEGLLDSWPGTLIVVSHDRYLLERVTDMQYALLGDGHLRHLPGGVDEYLRLRKHSLGSVKSGDGRLPGGLNSSAGNSANSGGAGAGSAGRAASAGSSAKVNPNALPAGSAARRDAEKNLARVERALEKINTDEASLHLKMATFDQSDFEGLATLVAQQQAFNDKREALELEWLETTDLLS